MTKTKRVKAPDVDSSLWEHAYRYIFIQYPDPTVAKKFMGEALVQLELSKKSQVRLRRNSNKAPEQNQPQAATQTPTLHQPPLYSIPEAAMPEAWQLLFFLSAVCATKGKELEARVRPSTEDLLVWYVVYLLYLTMKKLPDDRALVWGTILMSYSPNEVQHLIANANTSFRKRKRLYLAQVQQRFGFRTRTVNRQNIIDGRSATSSEVQLIEAVAREFSSWLRLSELPPKIPACPLWEDVQLSVEAFSDLAMQRQRAEKKVEIKRRQGLGNGRAPTLSERDLDRRVEIELQWPHFELMRHVLACPECRGLRASSRSGATR